MHLRAYISAHFTNHNIVFLKSDSLNTESINNTIGRSDVSSSRNRSKARDVLMTTPLDPEGIRHAYRNV